MTFRKVLIKMKRSLFLLMVSLLSVHSVAFSQTTKVSVNLTDTPLSEIFAELGKQARVVFLYDHKLIETKGIRQGFEGVSSPVEVDLCF